ncbi:uncharacterized protein [Dermacentor albipictus]|uniref:uncharacterized protein n=1 Tax=Dermacentor albipictus TaxID=60249 RepID=UPI0031FD7C8C
MELFDASSPGRHGGQNCNQSSIKELLQQVYSAHIGVTQGLQKQVSSLTSLLCEKDRELRNVSCQHCASVKDTFERYKASYQQIIEKLETKISLLEGKVSSQEKELRGRNVSPVVSGTPQRSTRSECRRQLLNCSVSPKLWDSVLQEDSPRDTSCLVPPSPTTTDEPAECEEALEAAMCTAVINGKSKKLPPLAVQTVPETLEIELYCGGVVNEITSYQPPLSAIAEKEESSGEDSVRSRGNAPTEVANNQRFIDCAKEQEKTGAEAPESESSLLGIDEQEDRITDAESEGSPSLLQQDKVAHPVPPRETWDDDEVPPTSVASGTTPAQSLSEVSCHKILNVMDDGDKSPSLLDVFAAPKSTAAPVTSEVAVKVVGSSGLPATEVTVCDDDLDPKSVLPSGSKLSLLRKRRASPTEAADVSIVQPPSRAKRKKQTKLSDRYFLSINRTTVPATRSSSRSTKKELSQTHVDTHFTEDSLFSMQRKHVDLDETFVSPGLLQDFKTPPAATISGLPGALENGGTPEVKQDSDNAGANHAQEASSSSSQEEPVKYHNSPVRKKADRQRLPAHDCKECQEFYGRLALPEAQRKDLLRKCSRHRAHHAPPSTPENFWELDFPDTQECRERGYLNATQKYVFGSKGLRKDGRK